MKMNWIKVEEKDKLPPELEYVIFTDGNEVFKGFRKSCSLGESEWDYWYSVSETIIEGVTHWMPLPDLPRK